MAEPQDQTTAVKEMAQKTVANPDASSMLVPQIQLEASLLEDVTNWISAELELAKNRRNDMVDRLNMLNRTYEAQPEEARKTFPWDGACNLVVPVAATAVETVFTRITGSIFGAGDLYAGRSRSGNWADAVEPIVTWLNWVSTNVFDAEEIYGRWILSCIKNGTSVLKLPWSRKIREVRYMDSNGGMMTGQVVLHDGPDPQFVPLQDFFWSVDADSTRDIQNCEWVAHRFRNTWKQIKDAEYSGDYLDVDRIKANKRTQFEDSETDVQDITGNQPNEPGDYELWEVWGSYPIDDSGALAEIVVTIHLETRTVIRAVYNFYRHQERPFFLLHFFPRENSLISIGLVEMLVPIQEEITALHRSRIDNATIANSKIYKRKTGANVGLDDIYPGAIIDVENEDDLTNMDMGQQHNTLLLEEQHTNTIGEKRSGVSDYSVGRESSAIGSRATATSTMALIREGNRRFQFLIREARKQITSIGHQMVSLYQQFAPNREVAFELYSPSEKQWFDKVMTLPPELSRSNIVIDVKALDDSNNKEIQQQAYMMMLKVVQETYMSIGNAFMLIINPQAPDPLKGLATQGAETASKLLERLLEAFDFKDAENFSPNIEQLLGMTAALEMGGSIANAAGNAPVPGAGGNGPQPGMAAGSAGTPGSPGVLDGGTAQPGNGSVQGTLSQGAATPVG